MGRLREVARSGFDERPRAASARDAGATERMLIALSAGLGARRVACWSGAEHELAVRLPSVSAQVLADLRGKIGAGEDPLGEMFCQLRSAESRRSWGATYTPLGIVRTMLEWAEGQATPERVVDAGAGSGRFLVEAGRRFPRASLVGVELDPVAAMLARAHLAAAGLARRSQVILGDYREAHIPAVAGKTLFVGNPPYIRHHFIERCWKSWLVHEAKKKGLPASQLAGLHVHFFLATALKARPGDFGSFITAAEWLDVNYGSLVRELFVCDLGGRAITVIEPRAMPFPDAASTAVIASFEVGARPKSVYFRRAATLEDVRSLAGEHAIPRERLAAEHRWSGLTRPARNGRAGYVELGELCRVHRGQVTGANKVWIAGEHSEGLPPSVLFPSVTKARELITAGRELTDRARLRQVIDLPVDLGVFEGADWKAIDRFLALARHAGVHKGYIASTRKAWWSVGLRKPAPILATYMARRPPAFVRNRAEARHINIAHGLYPREPLDDVVLGHLVSHLSVVASTSDGRTYAGGLTKFEPREMERLLVPDIGLLRTGWKV
jgi:adenine-specific DNA-methyltransferase